MGRAFLVSGEVIHGNHLGSTVLNMPTANIKWPENKVFPRFGVYFTEIVTDNMCYKGVTNVGLKPTVKDTEEKSILAESYLMDFNGDLYGKNIIIKFYDFLRPEEAFEGLDVLKEQLRKDLQAAQNYWGTR